MKSILKALFFVVVFSQPHLFAQKHITTQSLTWLRFQTGKRISAKWTLKGEVDGRLFLPSYKRHQSMFRTQGRYKLQNGAEVGIGVIYLRQYPNTPEAPSHWVSQEVRPQADLTLKHSLGIFKFSHRYQGEYRFIRDTLDHRQGLFRFRYRAQADFPLHKSLHGLASYEAILNRDDAITANVFDQNRLYFAVLHPIAKGLEGEVGYLHVFQERSNGTDFFNRHILRLSLNHQF